jgi:hypothetical protein
METCAHWIRGVPKLDRIRTSFCVAAAAATPTIKLAVETMPSLAQSPRLSTSRCGRRGGSPDAGTEDSSVIPPVRSDPPKQHRNDNDDQGSAEDTDATVTEAVTVAAESATEATEQEIDEDDNEDGSERQRPDLRGAIKFRTMPRRI